MAVKSQDLTARGAGLSIFTIYNAKFRRACLGAIHTIPRRGRCGVAWSEKEFLISNFPRSRATGW